MIDITLSEIAEILNGKIFGIDKLFYSMVIKSISIDTNKITCKHCLFIAIKGKRFDSHNFAEKAKEAGACALLVNYKLNVNLPQVVVKDTKLALGKLAAWVRNQSSAQVVALTGSSGKTSVKEMTTSILNQCGNTLYTKDNLNNYIGVSLTLLSLTEKHNYAVIELGANHHGEIASIVNLVSPKAVLVNNILPSHLDGFHSIEGIAKAKGEIYTNLSMDGIAIMNNNSNDWLNWQKIIGSRKIWFFSSNDDSSDFTATNIRINLNYTKFFLNTPMGNIDILMSLLPPGIHNVSNALAASALSMAVGASLISIKIGLAKFKSISGRLYPIILAKNKFLLNDSYNANIGSMKVAIDVLCKMPGYRVMVVGDMTELGDKTKIYHAQIGKIIRLSNLDCVLSIGNFSNIISKVSGIGKHFANKKILIKYIKCLLKKYEVITILVKGSRVSSMEDIVYALKDEDNIVC